MTLSFDRIALNSPIFSDFDQESRQLDTSPAYLAIEAQRAGAKRIGLNVAV